MTDMDVAQFDVRALSRGEEARQLSHTKSMLFVAIGASLAIVGAGAFVLGLWF